MLHVICNLSQIPGVNRRRMNGLTRPPYTNQFTNHMQKALFLVEKGPLALVAGEGFEPSTSGL